ncbi:DUF1616 domain-containing protein [Halorussus salinisoli]|uniref:DUF1616 domain-containing protein n=1 Tax=Halorussus salinisoli TaxID=2558242 RepID=UPI0010C19ECD|nr:DUF1616 domain-containing protein [Halorussus salinisoli]
MSSDSDRVHRLWLLLPRSVRRLPADLAAVLAVVVLTCTAVLTPGLQQTPLRVLVGLPFVLFIPGYAFIAALFPETGKTAEPDTDTDTSEMRSETGIDGIERVALSFGTSIAIVPMIGLLLNFTPWGIRLVPILVAVSGFTVFATGIAATRRLELPPEERFRVPYEDWAETAKTELFEPDDRTDKVLNALLVLSVLLAAVSVTYAVAVPKQGEAFTEFYVLTENETGDLVADDYPTEYTVGESKPLYVGIGNHEHRQMDYSVVVELQKVTISNNTTRVQTERELTRFGTSVGANETWQQQLNITPTIEGQRLRLAFLLYKENPPAEPTVKNAYRELHLWVNVTATQSTQHRVPPSSVSSKEQSYAS